MDTPPGELMNALEMEETQKEMQKITYHTDILDGKILVGNDKDIDASYRDNSMLDLNLLDSHDDNHDDNISVCGTAEVSYVNIFKEKIPEAFTKEELGVQMESDEERSLGQVRT